MRTPRRAVDIPAASLADIAFLLLIFFLVTAAITTARGFHFTLPALKGAAAVLERQDVFVVRLQNDASLSVDGQPVGRHTLAEFLRTRRETTAAHSVIFEVSRACPYGEFARAANQIRLAGFGQFAIKGVD